MTTRLQIIHVSLLICLCQQWFSLQGNALYRPAKAKMCFKPVSQASCLLPTMFQWSTPPFSEAFRSPHTNFQQSFTMTPQSCCD